MKTFNILIYLLAISTLFPSCKKKNSNEVSEVKTITIIYTNDEHGWMQSADEYGGASGMVGLWEAREAYDGSDSYLILSGGDMWTGPAISTWFKGESMVAAMNQMGYDAAALGNHEFDFTTDVLNVRLGEMNFPILAANIYEKGLSSISKISLPKVLEKKKHVWHLYVIRVKDRNNLQKKIKRISQTLIHYPLPPHLQECYASLNFKKGSFPISENIHKTIISLPISPVMDKKEAIKIVKKIRSILK